MTLLAAAVATAGVVAVVAVVVAGMVNLWWALGTCEQKCFAQRPRSLSMLVGLLLLFSCSLELEFEVAVAVVVEGCIS